MADGNVTWQAVAVIVGAVGLIWGMFAYYDGKNIKAQEKADAKNEKAHDAIGQRIRDVDVKNERLHSENRATLNMISQNVAILTGRQLERDNRGDGNA